MKQNYMKKTFTLSSRDIMAISQAKVNFAELTQGRPNIHGLPPLWSKMAYVMVAYPNGESLKHFWVKYREISEIAANRDCYYRRAIIPKNGNGLRRLQVPRYELMWHQHFILKEILRRLPISEHACAYRKGVSLIDLAAPHVGNKILLHFDIKDFFHSIDEQKVFECLIRETGYSKSVCGFLSRLCCDHGHLPQGACTSPMLSNICFKPCDEEIALLASQHNLVYTRYSDDIYISGDIEDEIYFRGRIRCILARNGYQLNSAKTRALKKHQSQQVTSLVINEKLQVNRKYRRALRQEIHYIKRYREDARGARTADSYLEYLYRVQGKIAFVLFVDPENREFLAAKDFLTHAIDDYQFRTIPNWTYL